MTFRRGVEQLTVDGVFVDLGWQPSSRSMVFVIDAPDYADLSCAFDCGDCDGHGAFGQDQHGRRSSSDSARGWLRESMSSSLGEHGLQDLPLGGDLQRQQHD